MELDRVWAWKSRKLACRIRVETGNPTGDDLRERFAELAGADLREVLADMKNTKKKKEQADKLSADHEADSIFKALEKRSHILGATQKALTEMEEYDQQKKESFTQRNLNKVFTLLPKSPPKRILREIQRERSKPLKLPDQNEGNEATARLQRRLAKQRAAIKAAMNSTSEEQVGNGLETFLKKDSMGNFIIQKVLRNYSGDQFSTGGPYLESMIYLSRMSDTMERTTRKSALPEMTEVLNNDLTGAVSLDLSRSVDVESRVGSNEESTSVQEDNMSPDSSSKLYCATVLCNWARNPLNAERLAAEGAVRAIMTLIQEPDPKTVMFCAASFRFMSEYTPTATSMIEEGAIALIGDIIQQSDDFVAYNLAIALVNLSRVAGREANVVDSGIVLALMNVISFKSELSAACARGLYNLTCVDGPYPLIERVIRALVSLSSSNTASVKHICAAALCNLSDLKLVRARLVEEGTVNILTTLSRGAETRTRRICAVILQNLSASKGCRVDMTSRNSVNVAYSLSADPDPIIQRAISLTLSRLAQETVNISRIIYENGVIALCNIGSKYPNIPGVSEPVAMAFQLLSRRAEARQSFILDGCSVTALATLLRLSTDLMTLQHTLLALSNLLIEIESHVSVIQSGLLLTILNLCEHENDTIRELCSLALLNFSCTEESRKHLINGGTIVAIKSLALRDNVVTRRRCAATLCKLSYFVTGRARMVSDGIIPTLVDLVLSPDAETVHHACSAMCRLCCSEENGKIMLESNAIPNLIKGALSRDVTTMRYCGAVLSALSSYESCRIPLIECGMLKVLKTLSNANDNIIKQRCLFAYANLSCESSVHVTMVNEGVIKLISELAESYQEINYICCAKAMCNLACNAEVRTRIANDGGVYTLLMISMVHSVDKETKLLCLMALLNLLDDSTLNKMLEEGIIPAVSNNSKIMDSRIEYHCALLFNRLSTYDAARVKMVEKNSYMLSLFEMMKNENRDIQILAAKTCCNLVFCKKSKARAIEVGVVNVLESGIQLGDEVTMNFCLRALFAASSESSNLAVIANGSIPSTLGSVALRWTGEPHVVAIQILQRLCGEPSSRKFLQNEGFFKIIVKIVDSNLLPGDFDAVVSVLRFLVYGYSNHFDLLKLGLFDAIWSIFRSVNDESLVFVSEIFRMLLTSGSTGPNCIDYLAKTNFIDIFKYILKTIPDNVDSMYNIVISLAAIAFGTSQESRMRLANSDVAEMLCKVAPNKRCHEIVIAVLCAFLLDTKCREPFLNLDSARIIHTIINTPCASDVLFNSISCIFAMSKVSKCIELLNNSDLQLDSTLTKILQSKENHKIKANCTRTLKNLASDATGSLEEGTVASLISMNLEGKNKNKMGDDLIQPQLPNVVIDKVGNLGNGYSLPENCFWNENIILSMGGPASQCPDAPEPPVLVIECCSDYQHLSEDSDNNDGDGKIKMAFAKMPIPSDLKSAYVLTDADFDNNGDKNEEEDAEMKELESLNSYPNIMEEGLKIVPPEDSTVDTPSAKSVKGNRSRSSSSDAKGIERKGSKFNSLASPKAAPSPMGRRNSADTPDAKSNRKGFSPDAKGAPAPSVADSKQLSPISRPKSSKNVKMNDNAALQHNLYS